MLCNKIFVNNYKLKKKKIINRNEIFCIFQKKTNNIIITKKIITKNDDVS